MLNLEDLSQLAAFYKYGTLTKVAEELHISQPTITRTMKRVEEAFGVSLFTRTSNRIELNEVGVKAAESAIELLNQAERIRDQIIEFDKSLHTVNLVSCAPAPLWSLAPELTRNHPGQTISSTLSGDVKEIEQQLREGKCDYAILPYPLDEEGFSCRPYIEEHLYVNVPKDHALAKYSSVTADMINGYNCLLTPDIGFWENFCYNHLPNSKFLIQKDEFSFRELIKASSLPCFTTDLAVGYSGIENRIDIPITDADANITFYLITSEYA